MMPLNHILRKCTTGYNLTKSQEKINHMDDCSPKKKKKKELKNLTQTMRIYAQDIWIEFSIEKCAMLIMQNGKRHMTVGTESPNKEKIRMPGEKEFSGHSDFFLVWWFRSFGHVSFPVLKKKKKNSGTSLNWKVSGTLLDIVVTCRGLKIMSVNFDFVRHKNRSHFWSRSHDMFTDIACIFESFLSLKFWLSNGQFSFSRPYSLRHFVTYW